MVFGLLADLVVLLHLAFVVFVTLGGLLAARWPRLAWVHLPAAAWGAWVEFTGRVCPLTPIENRLRERAGRPGYSTDFVEHYLIPVLYPPSLTRGVQWALGITVILVNVAVYATFIRKRPHR